jgi:hypothetical protein
MTPTWLGWTRKYRRGAQTRETAVREHLVVQTADRGVFAACGVSLTHASMNWQPRPRPGAACYLCRRSAAYRDYARERGEVR